MTRFQRDLEVIINEGFLAANNGKIRFVFRYQPKGEVGCLDLGERAYNCVRRKGLHTVEAVGDMFEDLWRIKGAGTKTIKEIKNKYLAYYYSELTEPQKQQFWVDTIQATVNME